MSSTGTVRVRLRYTDLETFIERFAPNVTRGGIFLASRTPRAEGELFFFEVQLASGAVALSGEGKVIWVKAFNPAEPQKPHGKGVQFVRIDPGSRETLDRTLQVKGTVRPAGGRATPANPTLQRPGAAVNGRSHVDTNVDLASEYGIEETTLQRIIDRNWALGPRDDDNIEELLKPEPVETATLAQALSELPRLVDPSTTMRRRSGPQALLENDARVTRAAADRDDRGKNRS